MNKKYVLSIGTNSIQGVNRNTFTEIDAQAKALSFTVRNSSHVTPANDDYISLERRRKYQYYEKKWYFQKFLSP